MAWFDQGNDELPKIIKEQQYFSDKHMVTALIYEYVVPPKAKQTKRI